MNKIEDLTSVFSLDYAPINSDRQTEYISLNKAKTELKIDRESLDQLLKDQNIESYRKSKGKYMKVSDLNIIKSIMEKDLQSTQCITTAKAAKKLKIDQNLLEKYIQDNELTTFTCKNHTLISCDDLSKIKSISKEKLNFENCSELEVKKGQKTGEDSLKNDFSYLKPMISVSDATKMFEVDLRYFNNGIKKGRLPISQKGTGKKRFVSLEDLEKFDAKYPIKNSRKGNRASYPCPEINKMIEKSINQDMPVSFAQANNNLESSNISTKQNEISFEDSNINFVPLRKDFENEIDGWINWDNFSS